MERSNHKDLEIASLRFSTRRYRERSIRNDNWVFFYFTISIPDSLGLASPEDFSQLLQMIFNRVPNIDQTVVSVHCHDDLGMAVDNSLIALSCGVRQIECAINGLGARKANADFRKVVTEVLKQGNYQIDIDTSLMSKAAEFIFQIAGIFKEK
ncbi:hypothetical protein PQG02_16675 [Nostoc sp. UHCC 0926]|uniref:hypothetical protein n=1 Tax=unclassified Nostoc TaxID=2593658 RepID=UPI00236210A3|nr:hypothetical protein [Nostoc sp. UHCC 0926]WDD30416.1 hypothetical protein PQG02_16675 [Nostoc sp. UHCC 0926]